METTRTRQFHTQYLTRDGFLNQRALREGFLEVALGEKLMLTLNMQGSNYVIRLTDKTAKVDLFAYITWSLSRARERFIKLMDEHGLILH